MASLKSLCGSLLSPKFAQVSCMQTIGMKMFKPTPDYSNIVMPERVKLTVLPKVPQYPNGVKPPKMPKRLLDMRGPEEIHNELLHKQYGIVAITGGRLRPSHLEMIRLTLGRKIDTKRMFMVWRIPAPWKPVTKKGQGKRMGGGKGSIHHYVSPVKGGRIIMELGGKCSFNEVLPFLKDVAEKMPFKAKAVSHETMLKNKGVKAWKTENNTNPYTYKYYIQNNLQNCQQWCSPYDNKWFGEYQ